MEPVREQPAFRKRGANADAPKDVFVEVFRLLVVLAGVGAGRSNGAAATALGALAGFVLGGVLGRFIMRGFGTVERRAARIAPHKLLVGGFGGATGGLAGAVFTVPLFFILPWMWAYPPAALVTWSTTWLGARLAANRAESLLGLAGLSTRPLVTATPYGDGSGAGTLVVDSSAAIDGRLLDVVRAGFVDGHLLVPRFVLDELQGIADAGDPHRRRRGRRGLEMLDALGNERSVTVHVLDDEMPEFAAVDAKLVGLARRIRSRIVTTDTNLARVAEVQGVPVLSLARLSHALRPVLLPGEQLAVGIEREGRESGQGVGYLEDGTMVVVENAAAQVGEDVDVTVTGTFPTAGGRMVFARRG